MLLIDASSVLFRHRTTKKTSMTIPVTKRATKANHSRLWWSSRSASKTPKAAWGLCTRPDPTSFTTARKSKCKDRNERLIHFCSPLSLILVFGAVCAMQWQQERFSVNWKTLRLQTQLILFPTLPSACDEVTLILCLLMNTEPVSMSDANGIVINSFDVQGHCRNVKILGKLFNNLPWHYP